MTLLRRKRQKKVEPQRYRDGHGVAFDDVRFLLGEERHRWQPILRVIDPTVCEVMHARFSSCWECGARPVECHHEASGYLRGKSDEYCCIFMLCRQCHEAVGTEAMPRGRLLFLKHKHDRANCDWVRLTLLRGSFLADLITD